MCLGSLVSLRPKNLTAQYFPALEAQNAPHKGAGSAWEQEMRAGQQEALLGWPLRTARGLQIENREVLRETFQPDAILKNYGEARVLIQLPLKPVAALPFPFLVQNQGQSTLPKATQKTRNIPSNDFQYLKLQKSPFLSVHQSCLPEYLIANRSSLMERAFPSFFSKEVVQECTIYHLHKYGLWSLSYYIIRPHSYLLAISVQKVSNTNSIESPVLITKLQSKHVTEGQPSQCYCFQLSGVSGRAVMLVPVQLGLQRSHHNPQS